MPANPEAVGALVEQLTPLLMTGGGSGVVFLILGWWLKTKMNGNGKADIVIECPFQDELKESFSEMNLGMKDMVKAQTDMTVAFKSMEAYMKGRDSKGG